jgi:hypothetical protein
VISSVELVHHVTGDREDDRHPGGHGRRRPGQVDDQGTPRGAGATAGEHAGRLLGDAATAKLLGDAVERALDDAIRTLGRLVACGDAGAPVVTMRRAPSARAARSAVSTLSAPSAMMRASAHSHPASRSAATAIGPAVSARTPAADRSETVITTARLPTPPPYAPVTSHRRAATSARAALLRRDISWRVGETWRLGEEAGGALQEHEGGDVAERPGA